MIQIILKRITNDPKTQKPTSEDALPETEL
jgi:hypothetical protein